MYIPEKKLFLVEDYEITVQGKTFQFCVTEEDIKKFILRWMLTSDYGDWFDSVMFMKPEQTSTCAMADLLNNYGIIVFTEPQEDGVHQLVLNREGLLSAFAELVTTDLMRLTQPADVAHIPPEPKENVIYFMLKLEVLNDEVMDAVMQQAVVDKTHG